MNASPEGRRPVRRTSVADRSTPQIDVGSLRFRGRGLVRPECVLATADGSLYTADWRGGVAQTRPDGTQALFAAGLPGTRAAATQRHRAASRRLLPARRPGRRRRRRVRAVARRGSGPVPAERRRRRPAADQLRRRGCVGPGLDHGEHPATAARRRLPQRRRRRLHRRRRRARCPHRCRRPGLHQRGAGLAGRPLAVRQRDLRPAHLAVSPRPRRRRSVARETVADLRRRHVPRRPRASTPRAESGSPASSATA